MSRFLFVFVLLTVSCCYRRSAEAAPVMCIDEDGLEVDWYYMYKLPQHYTNSPSDSSTGYEYLYVSSRSGSSSWQYASTLVNESDSMPALTLQPLFNDANVLVVAYNDEFPNGTTSSTGGHTKGVVATDGLTAIWLVHSVPKYPTLPQYSYPASGARYGQSFLCLSLAASQVQLIGNQLVYNEPHIYHAYVPPAMIGTFPSLERAVAGEWPTDAPYNNTVELLTLGGTTFQSFAKTSRYDKDLYEAWMAPQLDTNLLVETWRNGQGNLPSNCSAVESVFNVRNISLSSLQIEFATTSDHSKWAVAEGAESTSTIVRWWHRLTSSAPANNGWICVGDINRQEHQLERGGGSVCQQNADIAQLYRELIAGFEPCPLPTTGGVVE